MACPLSTNQRAVCMCPIPPSRPPAAHSGQPCKPHCGVLAPAAVAVSECAQFFWRAHLSGASSGYSLDPRSKPAFAPPEEFVEDEHLEPPRSQAPNFTPPEGLAEDGRPEPLRSQVLNSACSQACPPQSRSEDRHALMP